MGASEFLIAYSQYLPLSQQELGASSLRNVPALGPHSEKKQSATAKATAEPGAPLEPGPAPRPLKTPFRGACLAGENKHTSHA